MGALARLLRRLRYGRPVVVVSGLPRSGTSLMMQMLKAGGLEIVTDGERAPDGSNPKGYFELEAVKELEKGGRPAWLDPARGKAVKVVSPLVRRLPATRAYDVVFMQRSLDEVLTSQNRMLADRGTPADHAEDDRVKELYRRHLDETLRILAARPHVRLLVVEHGDAVARPSETAERVNRFLGGHLDAARMAAIADPALYRNRART
jgi:hypothetical protein